MAFSGNSCVLIPVFLGASGSCPNLIMSRSEPASLGSDPVTLTPQLLPRVHRPLCVSVSSDSSGRFKALETPEWKNNLKAQVGAQHSKSNRPLKLWHIVFKRSLQICFKPCVCEDEHIVVSQHIVSHIVRHLF